MEKKTAMEKSLHIHHWIQEHVAQEFKLIRNKIEETFIEKPISFKKLNCFLQIELLNEMVTTAYRLRDQLLLFLQSNFSSTSLTDQFSRISEKVKDQNPFQWSILQVPTLEQEIEWEKNQTKAWLYLGGEVALLSLFYYFFKKKRKSHQSEDHSIKIWVQNLAFEVVENQLKELIKKEFLTQIKIWWNRRSLRKEKWSQIRKEMLIYFLSMEQQTILWLNKIAQDTLDQLSHP